MTKHLIRCKKCSAEIEGGSLHEVSERYEEHLKTVHPRHG